MKKLIELKNLNIKAKAIIYEKLIKKNKKESDDSMCMLWMKTPQSIILYLQTLS